MDKGIRVDKELQENMIKLLSEGVRQDNRKFDEFRDIKIELGIVEMAEGSARVTAGETEIIAGVKLKIDKPFGDTPDEGILMVNTELTPLSNPKFESGPPSIESIELSRVIDRGLREGHAMDVKKLCIQSGEKVWVVNVDICPINHNGNIMDLGALAAMAAIQNTRFPEVDANGKVNYKKKTNNKLPIAEVPLPVTVIKIGDYFLIDPTENEEAVLDARLTVTFRKDGNLCAMQKGGEGPLSIEDISKMLDLAEKTVKKNRENFEKAIK
jgi:exosome complex component RRP42